MKIDGEKVSPPWQRRAATEEMYASFMSIVDYKIEKALAIFKIVECNFCN